MLIIIGLQMAHLVHFTCVVNVMPMFALMIKRTMTKVLGDQEGLGNDLRNIMIDFSLKD